MYRARKDIYRILNEMGGVHLKAKAVKIFICEVDKAKVEK